MSISTSLSITGLLVCNTDNLTQVVTTVIWKVTGNDGANTVSITGTTSLSSPDDSTFISYANLTETVVKTWIPDFSQDSLIIQRLTDLLTALTVPISSFVEETSLPWF